MCSAVSLLAHEGRSLRLRSPRSRATSGISSLVIITNLEGQFVSGRMANRHYRRQAMFAGYVIVFDVSGSNRVAVSILKSPYDLPFWRTRKQDALMFKVFAFLTLLFALAACGEDYQFQGEWIAAAKQADNILIENHLCPTQRDCHDGEFLLGGPAAKGIYVEIYGIQNQEILSKISDVFIRLFEVHQNMPYLQITAYKFSKKEDLEAPFIRKLREGNILNIEMERPQ